MPRNDFESIVERRLRGHAHDLLHTKRVVRTALLLADEEGADREVVEAAAWLHDLGRPHESATGKCHAVESARIARRLLRGHRKIDAIAYCIETHRFSTGLVPETLEARILQDADRLDSLGATGTARIFAFGAQHGRPMYDMRDPFAKRRPLSRSGSSLDHFYVKQAKLPLLMHTKSAKREAGRRWLFMKKFLVEFAREIV